jgi:beta-N-acetylhexosaminidase
VSEKTANCTEIVAAAFVTVSAYRGNVALAGGYPDFLSGLIAGKVPVMLVALGNPYLVRAFPDVSAYLTTYSPTPTSETALAKALFGEIAITGHLPVTIPGVAKYGDGIQVPAANPVAKAAQE